MGLEEEIYKLYQLEKLGSDDENSWKWLPDNPNRAFLICLGAGPWKRLRRVIVQAAAIEWYEERWNDLSAIPRYGNWKPFPLDWQNLYLRNIVMSLQEQKSSFRFKCVQWSFNTRIWNESLLQFFKMCGVGPEGRKCLWLFARDFLCLPSFPIDRHVKKALAEVDLPTTDSWYIIELCHKAGMDPSALNRSLFLSKSENYDWSDNATAMRKEEEQSE